MATIRSCSLVLPLGCMTFSRQALREEIQLGAFEHGGKFLQFFFQSLRGGNKLIDRLLDV